MALCRALLLSCSLSSAWALAADIQVRILDQQGVVLADAVAELQMAEPQQGVLKAEVAQQDLTFVPFVSAVQKGTAIDFPNMDKTRHHVYSFSPAKVFELKLYAGKPEAPIVFEKSGIVALGCNIHDYMQAFIYVGDSPFLAVSSDQGLATLKGVPAGTYQLKVWHPWQVTDLNTVSTVVSGDAVIEIKLPVTRQEKPQKPKKGFGNSYN